MLKLILVTAFSALCCGIVTTAEGQSIVAELVVPPSLQAHEPVWWNLHLRGGSMPENSFLIMDHQPRVRLLEKATGKACGRLNVVPTWQSGTTVGPLPFSIVDLSRGNTFRKRYLLNLEYGILPPGDYELFAQVYLRVDADVAANKTLPGREAYEFGTASAENASYINWALPEARAEFRVVPSTDDDKKQVLSRCRNLQDAGKLNAITLQDWVSLLLIDRAPEWEFLLLNFESAPAEVQHATFLFMLNDNDSTRAVQRANSLLSLKTRLASRLGCEVIKKRGSVNDAKFLRESLLSTHGDIRRQVYFTIAEMLDKPTSPELREKQVTDQDVQIALGWLRDAE